MKFKSSINFSSQKLVVVTSWLQKLISTPLQIFIMPLVISYLGVTDYALMVLISGLTGWYVLADISSGIAIQNKISEEIVKERNINSLILYSFIFYVALFLIFVFLVIFVIAPLVVKYLLINFITIGYTEKYYYVVLASILCLGSTLFGNIIKIYYSIHKGWVINIGSTIISVVTLLIIYLVTFAQVRNKLGLIIICSGLPSVALVVGFYLYRIKNLWHLFYFNEFILFSKDLLQRSKSFFIFSLNAALILQVDYVIISRFLGSNDIVQYNFVNKVFATIWGIYGAVLTAAYPILAERVYQKKWTDLKTILMRNILSGIALFLLVFIGVLIFLQKIELYFFHGKISISIVLVGLFMVYYCIRVWTDTFAFVLSAGNRAYDLFKISLIQGVVSIPLQIVLVKYIGISGIMLGLIMAFCLTAAWCVPYRVISLRKESSHAL